MSYELRIKSGHIRLLIQDVTTRVLLRSLLQFEGYEVTQDDETAAVSLQKEEKSPSLVIIDNFFSSKLTDWKRLFPKLPVFALVPEPGQSAPADVDRVFEKPLHLDALLEEVGTFLDVNFQEDISRLALRQ